MRQILETEEHVPIPPIMYSDPFYRITYLIKEEIRKYKWIEGEKGRKLSWERARQEWTDAYRETCIFDLFVVPGFLQDVQTSNLMLRKIISRARDGFPEQLPLL